MPALLGAHQRGRDVRRRGGVASGVRQNELSAIFLRGVFEQGASSSIIDPIWSLTPAVVAAGTYTRTGRRVPAGEQRPFLREGDLVMCRHRHHVMATTPTSADLDLQRRPDPDRRAAPMLRAVVRSDRAVYATIKPGATCGDLVRRPRPSAEARAEALLLGHGCGCDSARLRSSGPTWAWRFDDTVELVPGWCSSWSPSSGATAPALPAARRSCPDRRTASTSSPPTLHPFE